MAETVSMDHSPGMLGTQGSGEVAAKAGAMERPEYYLELAEGSIEALQKMFSSLKFNNEQCGYLAHKLKVVVQSGSSFLEVSMGKVDERFSSDDSSGLAEIFKLLVALGKQIESFVEGCCKDAWIQAAMTLTNVSQYVSSLGFNLELCRVAFCVDVAVSGCLTSDEVAGINKTEADIVEKKASADAHLLLEKLSGALKKNSLHGEDRYLAGYLLQRVLRFNPSMTFEDGTFLSKLFASFEDGTFWSELFASFEDGTFLSKLFAWVEPAEKLGRGASATVYKAKWLGTWVAKKTFKGSDNLEFDKEVEILSRLCHPNITSMFSCAKRKQNCSIIMELMDGDLNQLMEKVMERRCIGSADNDSAPFPILEAVDIMDQIGEGVRYLHSKRTVHRDLKSKNILYKKVKARDLDTGYVHVKVTDFGVSNIKDISTTNSDLTFNVGTNRWMPPEVMTLAVGKSKSRWLPGDKAPTYPFKVDTYSFGMVCYEILTGHPPFDGNQSEKDIKRRIMKNERPNLPDDCPPKLKTLIEKCWSQKPTERPTFAEICGELKYLKYLLISAKSKMHLDALHEPKFNEGDGTGPAVESHSVAALEAQAQEPLQRVPSLLNHRSDHPSSQSYWSASFYQSPDNQSLVLPPRNRSDSLSNRSDSLSNRSDSVSSSFKIDGAKHMVFLSHSGAQKDFVEQLCHDLERSGYMCPLFDLRHHSLPKGKDFVPLITLIKEAAQQCRVAVIVLSEMFLCSKWPMIELAEFHAAQQVGNQQLNMLPLFYKLAVDDLDDRDIEDRWMPMWRQLAKDDKRIDVEKWGEAVRALRKANGSVFGKNGTSEVGYRKEIVQSIFRLSPPDLLYGSSRKMVGYDRICEVARNRFVRDKRLGAAVLGLYGTIGRGKTTLCKALCDNFFAEFSGRVCHVELGEKFTIKRHMMMLKMTKLMLKNLCGFETAVLDMLTDYRQGLELLRMHVHREPVFLAIDNVTGDESSLREAREYLMVGFHPQSRILITSSSEANVQELLSGGEFCMAMPRLRVKEAGEIFLRSAAPMKSMFGLTKEERRIVGLCIQRCLFGLEGDEVRSEPSEPDVEEKQLLSESHFRELLWRSYHPVALLALGDFFRRYGGNTQMLHWKDHLDTSGDLLKDVWSSQNDIIGLQFSRLDPWDQLLFLDIALYARKFSALSEENFDLVGSRWLEWVSELHYMTAAVMERRLEDLTRSGMISYDDAHFDDKDGVFNVPVTTLFKEFAKRYATEHGLQGLRKNSWGVLSGAAQKRDFPLSDLVRLRVFDLSGARLFASKTMQKLHNLEVLQLHSCPNLIELDLQGLNSLRHLELIELKKLVTISLSGSSGTVEDQGIYESLESVMLRDLDSLTYAPDLRSCRSLHWLRVAWCAKWTNLEQIGEWSQECPYLKDLVLVGLVPEQWASIPIVESLPSLQHFHLRTKGYRVMGDVIDEAEGLECLDRHKNPKAVMLARLLEHLRSSMVDDSSRGWVAIEWNKRGCEKLDLWDSKRFTRNWE